MDTEIAAKLLELLETGSEGMKYIQNCIEQNKIRQTIITVLDRVSELTAAVEKEAAAENVPNRVKEINLNINSYIDKIKQEISKDPDAFVFDFRFHLKSLYRILEYEIAYLVEPYIDKSQYPDFYPEIGKVDHQKIIEQGKYAKYKVSIVVLAYNNLKYTKSCVEGILKNTKNIDYELILVNNGSTDETKAFFDSVKGAKVIHLKYNLHVVKGFNIGMMAAEGKYCAAVCNDFIFPSNWLNNLLTCIESDPDIGYVSPGSTNISNLQQIPIPFTTIEDFQEKARKYNVSDPRKWEERVVLLPDVLCCPTALLERIGYYDTRFFRGEFLDDDISFRIRRAGYKLIYCADTVTHHFCSITTESDHQKGSLEEGRKSFFKKYNLDAWLDARPDMVYLHIPYDHLSQVKSILGIEVKCGATLMQIKNTIWHKFGLQPALTSVTSEERYLPDLKTISDKAYFFKDLDSIPEAIKSKFDVIFIEKPLNSLPENLDTIFYSLTRVLKEQGKLIFRLVNYASINNILNLLSLSNALNDKKIYVESSVCSLAQKYGLTKVYQLNFNLGQNKQIKSLVENLSRDLTNSTKDKMMLQNILFKESSLIEMIYTA